MSSQRVREQRAGVRTAGSPEEPDVFPGMRLPPPRRKSGLTPQSEGRRGSNSRKPSRPGKDNIWPLFISTRACIAGLRPKPTCRNIFA